MKRLIIALAVIAVLAGGLFLAARHAARLALDALEEQRHDLMGLAIDIGGYALDWKGASLKLSDIRIYPAGSERPDALLAQAEELFISIAPRDVLNHVLHAKEVVLVRPRISVVQQKAGTLNWTSGGLGSRGATFSMGHEGPAPKGEEVKARPAEARKAEPAHEGKQAASGEKWKVLVDAVRIVEGQADYENLLKGQHLALRGLNLELTDIESEDDPEKLPTRLRLDARIGDTGGRLAVNGDLNLFAEGINFAIKASISPTPITYFHAFYAGATPYPIQAGSIGVASNARSARSQLRSSHHATISGLRVGGGIKGELINQFVLSRSGPIEVDAQVNGDLEDGKLSVSAALSKNIFDSILAQAQQFSGLDKVGEKALGEIKGAGEAAIGGGAKKAVSPIGGGLKKLLR